jgi:putative heme-binding domain-containing protein
MTPEILLSLVLLSQAAAPGPSAPQADPKPPDPEIERKSFKVAEGFEVTLFAADPLIAKPIQMNFDAKGRLWIATSQVYPQVLPGEVPNDKIVILEDTQGTGRADKSTVWAEGLFIPTGVEVGDGGAYVANSTELLHLRDTRGTGKADERRVILSGFGTEDTHHILHTFRFGPEGDLYFNQSIYIHSHIETPYGPRHLGGAGLWRFRPRTLELEIFCKGMCNPWGHAFDRWGQSFGTDGAGGDGIHFLMPGATYPHFPTGERFFPGLNPGHPKYCANEVISGRHFPEDWQGNIVTNDFRANRVVRFAVMDDGAGFSDKQLPDLITSTDRAFRPVDVRMGPDGALYIADWYNPIINHGEVGFRDPRRDKTHGRIWRVTAQNRPLVPRPRLDGAPVQELLEALRAPEDWTRHFAKRVLAERDPKEVAGALGRWVKTLGPDDDHERLEALWTGLSVDLLDLELLRSVLSAKEPRARAAATRVVAHHARRIPDAIGILEGLVADPNPRVRLEAVRALKEIPSERAALAAWRALDLPMDRFLDYSLWLTTTELEPVWMPAFEAGRLAFSNPKHADFALQAARSPAVLKTQLEHFKGRYYSAETREIALQAIAAIGGPAELREVLNGAGELPFQPKIFAALLRAARERGVHPEGDLKRIQGYFDAADDALRLAGAWKLEALRPELARRAQGGRRAAIDALTLMGGPQTIRFFQALSEPDRPPEVRLTGVLGLAALDVGIAATLAGSVIGADPAEVVTAFLRRKGGAEALAGALDPSKLTPDVARLGLRAMYAAGREEPTLSAVFNRVVGLKTRHREIPDSEMKQIVSDVLARGDAARGEAVFHRRELSCFQCHAIGGAGGQVGPDLLSLGASAPVDYIAESVLLPEKKSKEGYVSMAVLTKSGDVESGVRVRENDAELVLRDALRDEIVIPKKSIEQSKIIGSVMPAGLADLLTDQEFLDLVRFLTELGKPGPFAVGSAPVIRRWRILDAKDVARLGDALKVTPEQLRGMLWLPLYARVSGVLPLEELGAPRAAVRGDVDVTTPGRIRLRLNSAQGVTVLLDGQPQPARETLEWELGAGVHSVVLVVDVPERAGLGLRCEIDEAPGSPGRVHPVGGK